jgi:ABC-type lipoprotein release transport system permease subunit
MLMDLHHIEYVEIDDEEVYMPIAKEHKILSMPFAEIDGLVVNTKGLQKYIKENGDK